MSNVINFLKKHRISLSAIASIVVIVGFGAGLIQVAFRTPPLIIKVKTDKYVFPKNFIKELSLSSEQLYKIAHRRYSLLTLNNEIDSLCMSWNSILSFLSQESNYWQYEITNTTNKTIEEISIRIPNVRTLLDFSIEGNILSYIPEESLYSNIGYDTASGLLILSGVKKMPAKSTIIIKLWGMREILMNAQRIFVYSNSGEGKIIESTEVEGARAFIATHIENILLLLILVYFIIITTAKKSFK